VQDQATLDGSPVAQAVTKFMEDREEYTATSSEMHSKLKVVAAQLGVDVDRDKAWPKSARWLWRRIKEILPLLVAAGIEASRDDTEKASVITFSRTFGNDSSDPRKGKYHVDNGNRAGINERVDSSHPSNSSSDFSPNVYERAASGNSGDTGNRYGASSEEAGTTNPEEERRIRRLVEQGMAEGVARESVLGNGHSPFCDCEVCL
jgi:hypothetical protein